MSMVKCIISHEDTIIHMYHLHIKSWL